MSSRTIPKVFIIESLHENEESSASRDGQALCHILELEAERLPRYYYIRTKMELVEMARLFKLSNYRYLHLSCHGDRTGLQLRLEGVSFSEFAEIFRDSLNDCRLFVSACKVGVEQFATEVFSTNPECYSVVAPRHKPGFTESAVFWGSFYHLMFEEDKKAMKRSRINKTLTSLGKIFPPRLEYFRWSKKKRRTMRVS